ncbi:hypothetical protein HDU97_009652 [Phlyctochytrium planicorne]|nr:hypothetical protein HDU97_009652 [Phlyctochytrium planicorne]
MAEAKVATAEAKVATAKAEFMAARNELQSAAAIQRLQSQLAQLQITHTHHILQFTLPYLASFNSSTTTTKVPNEALTWINEKIHPWEDFSNILKSFGCPEITTKDPPPTFDEPAFSEGGLYPHIFNVFRWAKPCLAPKEHLLNVHNLPPGCVPIKSKNEVHRNYYPDIMVCDSHRIPYCVGEVKRDAIIPAHTDFANIDKSTPAFKALAQAVNYLKHFKCTYGILTSFNCWWFIKLDGPKVLVSTATRDNTKTPQVLVALAAVLKLARESKDEQDTRKSSNLKGQADAGETEDPFDHSFSPNFDGGRPGDNDGDAPSLGERGPSSGGPTMCIDRADSGTDVKTEGPWLGDGQHGGVFLEVVNGVRVAFKSADSENRPESAEAIFRESAVYETLKDLQGVAIARLVVPARMPNPFLVEMATEVASEGWKEDLTQDDLDLALVSLSAIHEKGYIHGDIRRQNLVFHRDATGRRALWIDLESCEPGTAEKMEEEKECVRKNRFDP